MTFERIVEKLRHWGRPWVAGTEPIEIHRAILEELESQVVAAGGGRRVFPFATVEVRLLAAGAEQRARLEAVVQEGWELERELRERLAPRDVRVPAGLAIGVSVTEEDGPEFGGRRYAISCRKADELGSEGTVLRGRPGLRFTILKGKTARETYDLTADRVYLGRLEEVLDAVGRVKRRNDIAFLEEGEVNQTVSREHARIAWDAEIGAFRVRDEGSASGTRLFRDGRPIEVSGHDRQGVRLQSGDEIYLGRAAVRVELGA